MLREKSIGVPECSSKGVMKLLGNEMKPSVVTVSPVRLGRVQVTSSPAVSARLDQEGTASHLIQRHVAGKLAQSGSNFLHVKSNHQNLERKFLGGNYNHISEYQPRAAL